MMKKGFPEGNSKIRIQCKCLKIHWMLNLQKMWDSDNIQIRTLTHPYIIITFCVSRRRCKMYCGHARLCVCLSAAVRSHYFTDPDVTWGRGRGCPLVVHYWADLQSVLHGLRCYGNITQTPNVSKYMLVLSLCLVTVIIYFFKMMSVTHIIVHCCK